MPQGPAFSEFGKFAFFNYPDLTALQELMQQVGRKGKHSLLVSNISWQGLERGTRILAGVFTGILLATYLGPGPLGIYSYALSFMLLFAPIVSMGYDALLPRDIIFEKDKWQEILGTSALLRFAGSMAAIGLIWGFIWLGPAMDPEAVTILKVLSLSFLFYPFDVFDIWFRAQLKSKNASISKIIAIVLINGLKVWYIWQKAPLVTFAWLYVAEFAINAMLQLWFYIRTEPKHLMQWVVRASRIRFILKEAWPLLVSTFSYMIYSRIDQVMIGNMVNNEQVGIFSAAGKIADIPVALVLVLNSVLYPYLANSFQNNPELFRRQYLMVSQVYTLISYAMLAVALIGANFIIAIYPHSFAAGAMVLRLEFLGLVFIFNSGLRNSYLSLTGNQKYLLYTAVVSALVNIALNYVMIPAYGINGAAWASAISEFLALFLLNGVFSKTRYILQVQARALLPIGLFRRR